MLMRPSKAETAVRSCHCPGDMVVRMGKVPAKSWVGVRVCQLLLLLFLTRGYAKRRNGFLLGLRYANVSLAHSGVESS